MDDSNTPEESVAPSPVVSIKQSASILDVTAQCLHKWINQGKMRAFRYTPNGQYRVPLSELDRLVRAGGNDPAAADRLTRMQKRLTKPSMQLAG